MSLEFLIIIIVLRPFPCLYVSAVVHLMAAFQAAQSLARPLVGPLTPRSSQQHITCFPRTATSSPSIHIYTPLHTTTHPHPFHMSKPSQPTPVYNLTNAFYTYLLIPHLVSSPSVSHYTSNSPFSFHFVHTSVHPPF